MLRISHPPHSFLPLLMTSPLVPHSGNSAMKWLSFPFSSYRVQNANIILNIPHIHSSALPPFTILGLMTRSQQRSSWLSLQSVALDWRGREFDSQRRPWSSIFRNCIVSAESWKIDTHAKYPYYLPYTSYRV